MGGQDGSVHPQPPPEGSALLNRGPILQLGEVIRQETLSRKAEEVGEGAWEGRGCFRPQTFPTRPPPPAPEGESREKLGGKRGAVRALVGGWEAARASQGASR